MINPSYQKPPSKTNQPFKSGASAALFILTQKKEAAVCNQNNGFLFSFFRVEEDYPKKFLNFDGLG